MDGRSPQRHVWRNYAVAVLLVVVATVVRLAFLGILGGRAAYITFYPAVTVAAILGGFGPGLVAAVLSELAANYFFVPPVHSFRVGSAADWVGSAIFLVSCVLICWTAGAKRRAEARASVLETQARLAAERAAAAEALRQATEREHFLAEALETMAAPFGIGADDGRLLLFNQAFAELTGYTREELVAKGFSWAADLTPPEWNGPEATELEKARETGRPVLYQKEYIRKDGSRVPIELFVHPGFDEAGDFRYYYSLVTDITQRKRAEEELLRQREWLRVTLSSIGDAVLAADSAGRVTFLNSVAAQLTGWTEAEALGQPIHAVFQIVNEITRQPADDIVARVLAEGRTALLANHTAVISRDGREIPIEDSAAPVRDAAGEIAGVVLVFHDVTEKRRALEALQASEATTRAILDATKESIWLFGVDGVILLANETALERVGKPADEVIGKHFCDVIPPDLAQSREDRMREAAASRQAVEFEDERAGRTFHHGMYPVLSADGGVTSVACFSRDITERRRAEHNLLQSQKLESVGLLAGGIAHDFNNLLVGVIGNASLAQEMAGREHQISDLLDGIVKTGEQLAHLTRQMLAYSGKGRFVIELLDLSDFVAESCNLAQPSIPKKVELRLELAPGLPPIEADRGQIQQVVMNLVINAAEAIGSRPGLVAVSTGAEDVDAEYARAHPEAADLPPGKYVRLEVRDTGDGMDQATRGRIFDPFFTTKFTGRGLGLAAVSGIVRGHRGAILVSSAPGKGSRFTVLFPAAQRAAEQSLEPAETALTGSETVLVVDDEAVVRQMARLTLERYGYRVLLAADGAEAVDVVKRHPSEIALTLLDLSMAGMSGEEALPALRRIRPDIRVVVSSGYSETEAMRLFGGARVSGFIQKPYTVKELLKAVKAAIG
jgi:PAS domain S-box-containing protein